MDRRTLLVVPGPVRVAAQTPVLLVDDERFMRLPLDEARLDDFPVGTVIVRNAEVVARGFSSGRRSSDPTAHGEMVAIRTVLAAHGPEELRGTTLYTTGEPCPLCTDAIL